MTSTPLPDALHAPDGITPPGVPLDETVRAIEHTRQLLDEALLALDSGDDDQLAHAYERAAGCADHIARALWFLHRISREHTGAAVPAATASPGTATAVVPA